MRLMDEITTIRSPDQAPGSIIVRSDPFSGATLMTAIDLLRRPALARWLRNRRERRELVALSDAMLHDIGLTRADVESEYGRPFWQPVDHAALEERRRHAGPRLGR
jgi:uncharacterized protein YjiS (DUF1127 family)